MAKPVPRIRKHKVRERLRRQQQAQLSQEISPDPNASEILPEQSYERQQRRKAIEEELVAKQTSNTSSKKRKRLDKYIVCGFASW